MPKQPLINDLAALKEVRHDDLLLRDGRAMPGLLKLALDVAKGGDPDHKLILAERCRHFVRRYWNSTDEDANREWSTGDAPWSRADRLVNDLMRVFGKAAAVTNKPATELPAQSAGTDFCSSWLIHAADVWKANQNAYCLADLGLPGQQDEVSIFLLFVNSRGEGKVAKLTLYRLEVPNAGLALAAAPDSALTPCTSSFNQALQAAQECWRRQVVPGTEHNTALAWDIWIPGDEKLKLLDGPSAGAALALCGLWLLKDYLHTRSTLRRQLKLITKEQLGRVYVTAKLGDHDALEPVGSVFEKTIALADNLNAKSAEVVRVYTALDQEQTLRARVLRATVVGAKDLLDLAKKVAEQEAAEAGDTNRSRAQEPFSPREVVHPRTQAAPDRQWCELSIADSHWRLRPGPDGPTLTPSPPEGIDGIPPGATLVADAEGRACAYLNDRQLQIGWLNRYAGLPIELWPAKSLTVPANLKLLSLTMCGDCGVEVAASGKGGLIRIRAEYPGTAPGWMQITNEDSSGRCTAAIFHSTSGSEAQPVAIRKKTHDLTPSGVSFGLNPIEFLDAGMTDAGLLYAAIGHRNRIRLLVLQWPGTGLEPVEIIEPEEIPLACHRLEGLVVVRNGAADDCVLVHADGRLLRLTELRRKGTHAPS